MISTISSHHSSALQSTTELVQKSPLTISLTLPETARKTSVVWEQLQSVTQDTLPFIAMQMQPCALYPEISYPVETSVSGLHANILSLKELDCFVLLPSPLFVAGQCPSRGTVETFWRFIHTHSFSILDLRQDPKDVELTETYYPKEGQRIMCGSTTISHLFNAQHEIPYHVYEVCTSSLKRNIIRAHFKEWPDANAVDIFLLDGIVETINKLGSYIFVHCLAGIGRTGTVITAYLLKKLLIKEIEARGSCEPSKIDQFLIQLITYLRRQRGPYFVMKECQFDLLRKYGYYVLINKRAVADIHYDVYL